MIYFVLVIEFIVLFAVIYWLYNIYYYSKSRKHTRVMYYHFITPHRRPPMPKCKPPKGYQNNSNDLD